MDFVSRKRDLRRHFRGRLTAGVPGLDGHGLLARVVEFTALRPARTLMAFTPWGGEVDTIPLLREWIGAGKRLALPVVAEDGITLQPLLLTDLRDLVSGYQGILEPHRRRCLAINPTEVDLVLVPGLAFDLNGTRLGRGKGHYDRLLAGLRPDAIRVGTCHAWQIAEAPIAPLPREPHDVPMHWIMTPDGFVQCGGDSAS